MHSFFFFSQVSSFFSFFLLKMLFIFSVKVVIVHGRTAFNRATRSTNRCRGDGRGVCEVKLDIAAKYLKEARSVEFR